MLFLAGCMHMPGQLPSMCFHIAINSVRFEVVTVVLMTVVLMTVLLMTVLLMTVVLMTVP